MSDAKLKHTPLPWHAGLESFREDGHWQETEIWSQWDSPEPKIVATLAARKSGDANARFIVAAVNSYPQREAMRSALEKLLSLCELAMSAPHYRSDEQKAALAEGYAALEVK
jgi:hypothetical protein